MAKIKIDSNLLAAAKKIAEAAGYSSVEEFVTHILEKEIARHTSDEQADEKTAQQLRGLGYIQ